MSISSARTPRACFRLVRSEPFDYLVMGVIVLNVFGMALDFHGIEEYELYQLYYTNGMLFFTYFYYCECVLKLFALGCIAAAAEQETLPPVLLLLML